jgi:hypothetical protein
LAGRHFKAPPNQLLDRAERDVDEYAELYAQHTGEPFADARIFEIGYGTRPVRLALLRAKGIDATGIDIEWPLRHPSHFGEVRRANGWKRAFRSLARYLLADRKLWHEFTRRYGIPQLDDLVVGDVADIDIQADLVVSEDVFEHLPYPLLETVVDRMASSRLALIRPNIWTGISGGHLYEWQAIAPTSSTRSEPWEHLRQDRFMPNTYLNRLTRADYRTLFSRRFDILEERVLFPDLGRAFLNGRTAQELRDWPEEELFSNNVLFVLRPRAGNMG